MMIDPNYGFVYANFGYLRGKRLFDFAEEGLLDKKLTPEDFQRYGLKEAYEKQKQIYETSLKEIMENTEFFEGKDIKNEKIKVAIVSKEVMSGSYICYYKYDCDYYVSFEIVSENKVKFSCMVNREKGIEKLPDKMVQKMRLINEKLKRNIRKEEIYIQENNQMIYIGGYKNPNNLLYVSDLLDVDSNTYDSKELAGKLTEFFKEGFFDT